MKTSLRKIRLAHLLPAIQVAITATLTVWGDKVEWMVLGDSNRIPGQFAPLHMLVLDLRTIWRGVNAPVFPLNLAGIKPLGQIPYIVAVAILWHAVGRAVDRQRGITSVQMTAKKDYLYPALMLLWGLLLLIIGLVPSAYAYGAGGEARPIQCALHLCWSLMLIAFAVARI